MAFERAISAGFDTLITLVEAVVLLSIILIATLVPSAWIGMFAKRSEFVDELRDSVFVARTLRIPVPYDMGVGVLIFRENNMVVVRQTTESSAGQALACKMLDNIFSPLGVNAPISSYLIPSCGEVLWEGKVVMLPFFTNDKGKGVILPASGTLEPSIFPPVELIKIRPENP